MCPTLRGGVLVPLDSRAHSGRNLIERLWCKLKDWRCVTNRPGKLTQAYLAGAVTVLVATYRLN